MSSDLIKQQNLPGIQPQESATSLLDVIARAVADPRVDVDKMKALLAMHKEIMAEQRKAAFIAARSRLQAKLPIFEKHGRGKNSMYAKLEDIHLVIQPLLGQEGLDFSFSEESRTDKTVTFVALLSHKDGHEEPKRLTLHRDEAALNKYDKSIRPPIQDDVSTFSYARRILIQMHLNIVTKDEDTDGESAQLIDEDQIKTIDTLLADSKSNRDVFFKMIAGVEKLELIPARDYRRIINSLQIKLREMNAKSL